MNNRNYDKKIFRLIFILNKLDSGKRIATIDLAKEFNVTLRTVQRDIELLNMAGFPLVCYERGVHSFEEGFSLKKMCMTSEEASLLTFAYDTVKQLGGHFDNVFKSIMSKATTNTQEASFYMKVPSGIKMEGDFQYLDTIENAIEEKNKIILEYQSQRQGKKKEYKIVPLKIAFYDGFWYLISQDEKRVNIVKFRLDKIKGARTLKERFTPPKNINELLNDSVNVWFTEKRDKTILLTVAKEAAGYFKKRLYFPLQKVISENKDGSLVIETKATKYDEVLPTILHWIPHIKVKEPEELREMVRNIVGEYLKN